MPLIQWILLNLEDNACLIESDSDCSGSASVIRSAACVIESAAQVTAIASASLSSKCSITSDSQVFCNGTVIHKVKPKPAFEADPANLVGTYAIVPDFFGKKKYKYVQVDFTFKEATYHNEFYSAKEIFVDIAKISIETKETKLPIVSLKKIEGLHGKTHDLQKQR